MVASARYDVGLLLLFATLGNFLGSTVNWLIGRYLSARREARWFPISTSAMARAERWYRRWGQWSLLLSWLPVVGDPLTLIAGVLRTPFLRFAVIVALAKFARYAVIAGAVLHATAV